MRAVDILFLVLLTVGIVALSVQILQVLWPPPQPLGERCVDRCRTLEAELYVVRAENARLTAELAKRSVYR